MTTAIRELEGRRPLTRARVERFLAGRTFPIVEGRNVTFVFHGAADAVYLQHWIYGLPSAQPFARLDGSDLWYLVQDIPPRSRVEYKLEVQRGDASQLIRDPLNPHLAHDPFGANSVCQGRATRSRAGPSPTRKPGPGRSRRSRFRARSSATNGR